MRGLTGLLPTWPLGYTDTLFPGWPSPRPPGLSGRRRAPALAVGPCISPGPSLGISLSHLHP